MSNPKNPIEGMESLSIDSPIEVPNSEAIINSMFSDNPIETIESENKEPEGKQDESPDVNKGKGTKPANQESPEKKDSINHEKILQSMFSDSDEDSGEEEKQDNTKKSEPVAQEDQQPEPGNKIFSLLAKDLEKLGVFSRDENESEIRVNTAEEFLERFRYESEKVANQKISEFIGRFGEDYVKAFDAIYVHGVNPREYFSAMFESQDVSSMDMSTEENQEYVVRQALLEQGFDKEDINKEIERLKNYGDLEEVSKRYHKVLSKKYEKRMNELVDASKERQRQIDEYKKNYRNSVKKILDDKVKAKEFDGIPINTKIANEVYEFVTVDKYKTANGDTLTEFDKEFLELRKPENFEKLVKVAVLMKIIEKDPSLSLIQNSSKSKKNNSLFEELTKGAAQSQQSDKKQSHGYFTTSWFGNY